MTYDITFNALTTRGEVVGNLSFSITTSVPLNLDKGMSAERFCVEYARLTGVKCSFANITKIDRKDEINVI